MPMKYKLDKNNNQRIVITIISMKIIILALTISTITAIDLQRQLQYQNTLTYLLQLSANNTLHQFDPQHFKNCVALQCCICESEFQSPIASGIHFSIYHSQLQTLNSDIAILFDQQVPPQEKYSFCIQYLNRTINKTPIQIAEEVCIVLSWNMYREQTWIQIIKYVLYIFIGLSAMIFYSQILKPWK